MCVSFPLLFATIDSRLMAKILIMMVQVNLVLNPREDNTNSPELSLLNIAINPTITAFSWLLPLISLLFHHGPQLTAWLFWITYITQLALT